LPGTDRALVAGIPAQHHEHHRTGLGRLRELHLFSTERGQLEVLRLVPDFGTDRGRLCGRFGGCRARTPAPDEDDPEGRNGRCQRESICHKWFPSIGRASTAPGLPTSWIPHGRDSYRKSVRGRPFKESGEMVSARCAPEAGCEPTRSNFKSAQTVTG